MKNLLNVLLLVLITFTLYSCESKPENQENERQNPTTATPQASPCDNCDGICSDCNSVCLSTPCLQSNNCNDPNCLQEIKNAHELTPTQYSNAQQAYYSGVSVPTPMSWTRQEVIDFLKGKPCDQYRIKYDINEARTDTHDNMVLYMALGHTRPTDEINSYSISLFQILLDDFPAATHFHFSRGMSCPSNAEKNDANSCV